MKKELKQILFFENLKAEYKTLGEIPTDIPDGCVLVKTKVSTLSCGTEKANFIGGDVSGVQPFPRKPGYSSAGEVIYVGNSVSSVTAGDRVVVTGFFGKHVNYVVVSEKNVVKIPETVNYADAAATFIASFSLAGLRKVKLEIGESCLVMGLGILGQFAIKLAHAMGAFPIIAVDPVKERREMAIKNGADYSFDPFDANAVAEIKRITGGGVNTAIEVTGVGAGLNQTLDCMKKLGRIALLGCTRNSDFSVDYYNKIHFPGITLVGAHTAARPQNESYPNYFTQDDDVKVLLNLIAGKRLTLSDIMSETHSPLDCQEVYTRLVSEKNFPVGVQFDWSEE